MILNLSGVLSEQHEPLEAVVPCEMEEIRIRKDSYPVISKEEFCIRVEHAGEHKLSVQGKGRLVAEIPCGRCLTAVLTEFELDFDREVDTQTAEAVSGETDELDENNYIDGYHLDVDRLLYNEILVGWPMKVLCSESCKGICNVCGQNLNEGTCDCEDTGIDPRMSVIRDVFKNFKEV